jgi:hypothetical protein
VLVDNVRRRYSLLTPRPTDFASFSILRNPTNLLGLSSREDTSPRCASLLEFPFGDNMSWGQQLGEGSMPKLDEHLRIREAAECVGVHQNTLRNWEGAGNIKVRRHPMNRYMLFKFRDLDKLMRDTERSVTPRRKRTR